MRLALIVEDELEDIRTAQACARAVEFDLEVKTAGDVASAYLDKGLRGEAPSPDVVILDLNLGHESGHEVLGLWHTTPVLKRIPMIVWSIYADEHKLICECFQVHAIEQIGRRVCASGSSQIVSLSELPAQSNATPGRI